VCRIVAEGGGVSLVEPITARDFCDRGELVARAFHPEITFQYSALFPVYRSRSLLCSEFLDLVESELAPGGARG
jgi:DNA-binding transcriptional LysR family regulator